MFLLYNILLTLSAPFWVPWMLIRSAKREEKPNWKERSGDFNIDLRKEARRIWVHAVSVGEVMAAVPLLKELRQELPEHEIVLTTTTSSGQQTAKKAAEGLYDHLFYFPIDVVRFQLAALLRVKPEVVVVMETELWFNFLWAARELDIRTMLVNGRISESSFNQGRRVRFFYKSMLKRLDRALMQTELDAERLRALGHPLPEVYGNTKFDEAAQQSQAVRDEVREEYGIPPEAQVVVVGSTRGEEEPKLVVQALAGLTQHDLYVIHAPRHLETVPSLCETVRQKIAEPALQSKEQQGRYLILDTYGELARAYAAADVAIIGGGFENFGGQNLIQPLAAGVPVLHGPHMRNFRSATEMATQAGASKACADAEELRRELDLLLSDPDERARRGAIARQLVEQNLGASHKYAQQIAAEAARFAEHHRKRVNRASQN